MFETAAEIDQLQELIDRSFAGTGGHMADIVKPERRLTALQVVSYLQNVKHVAFATVSPKGRPVVAPLDGWFLHGRFVVSTGNSAARARHIRSNPAVSLTHFVGDEIGIWAHGVARFIGPEETLGQDYERAATAVYGSSPFTWGDVAVIGLEPRAMFAYAMDPSKFVEAVVAQD